MMLTAVPETVREELVSARKLGFFPILTHLLMVYCPGGVQEKQTLLRNLEDPGEIQNMSDAPAQIRKWMRWNQRTKEIGAIAPDPTLLLKGLNKLTRRLLDHHKDLQFRVSLIRSSLMVDTAPSEVSVANLAKHILAEVDQLAHLERKTIATAPKPDPNKIKSMDAQDKGDKPDKGAGKGKSKDGTTEDGRSDSRGKQKCKFFLSDSGCKKGKECLWSHEERDGKRRCYICGALDHLAPACTRPRGDGSPARQKGAKVESEEGSTKTEETPKGSEESTVKLLLEEANKIKMLKSMSVPNSTTQPTSSSTSTPEEKKEDMMEKLQQQLNALRQKAFRLSRMAGVGVRGLVDSGATHPLRPLKSGENIERFKKVPVTLANGEIIQLRMTPGEVMVTDREDIEPILPMGAMVQLLQCQIQWTEEEVKIVHPSRGTLPVETVGGCPQIPRQLSLDLIQEMEEVKGNMNLKRLEAQQELNWLSELVQSHPVLRQLPQDVKGRLVVEPGSWTDIPANRRTRKRMERDGMVVHLYAGEDRGYILQRAWNSQGGPDRVLLEVDLKRSEGHDMLSDTAPYAGLLRAALDDKLLGLLGGPNCRTRSVLRNYPIEGQSSCPRPIRRWGGEEWGIKEATAQEKQILLEDDVMLWRMIFLSMVANYIKLAKGDKKKLPFSLEQPASPREYRPETVSFWDTPEWQQIKKEFNYKEETFEQKRLGGVASKPTTFGGNLSLNVEDFETEGKIQVTKVGNSSELARWPPGLMNSVASALLKQAVGCNPKIKQITMEEHVAWGHIPYRRDCRVCQESMQNCLPHRRVKHPQAGVLSLDTAGPLIPAYDQGGGKARYKLVGALTWRVPKDLEKLQQPPDQPLAGDEPAIEPEGQVERIQEEREEAEEQDQNGPEAEGEEAQEPPAPEEQEEGQERVVNLIDQTELRVFRMALPMITKTSREVTATAMEFVLRLRQDGYGVGRIHSDRGHEFCGSFQRWCRSRGIHLTRTPGDDPRANGRAEMTVKATKEPFERLVLVLKCGHGLSDTSMKSIDVSEPVIAQIGLASSMR